MDANMQLANDIHFLTAPFRFIWRLIWSFLLLFFAPAIFLIVPVLVVHFFPGDDAIGLLKVLLGVFGPFACAFWLIIASSYPKYGRRWARIAATSRDCAVT